MGSYKEGIYQMWGQSVEQFVRKLADIARPIKGQEFSEQD